MMIIVYNCFTSRSRHPREFAGYWWRMRKLLISFSTFLIASGTVSISQAQPVSITPGGVVNAASFVQGQTIAPGSLVAIFGNSLAPQLAQADSVPLATSLANVSVTFNGIAAPLDFVSSGQINAQVPFEVPSTGTVNVVVNNNGTPSAPQTITVSQLSPGIFQFNNHAIAVNVTDPTSARYATISAPSGSIQGLTTFPAQIGDILFLYATGLGPTNPAVASGHGAGTVTAPTTTNPVVMVGGTGSNVLFSGLTSGFPGVYQVNFVIPQVASGPAVPLQIQMGGITTPNTTNIAVQ